MLVWIIYYSCKRAEWGVWEQVFKNKNGVGIGESIKWTKYPWFKNEW